MDQALFHSAVVMGLAGTPNCLAMCGAACTAAADSGRGLVFSQPQRLQLAGARCLVVRTRRALSDVPRRWGNAASEESRPLNIQIGTNVQKNPLMNSGPPP